MFRFIAASAVASVLTVLSALQPCVILAHSNPAGSTHIEAERIRYVSDPEAYEAEGDVVIFFEGGYLKADRAYLEIQSGNAEAEGNVFIQSGDDVLEGETVVFNIHTQEGTISDGRIFYDAGHVFLSGKTVEKRGDNEYSFLDAEVTTCCGEVPDWKITGKRINVTVDGYGTISHGSFRVKDVPLLYLPYMIVPVKTTRQSGFLQPRMAFSRDKLGWDLGIPFYWALSESVDATFFQRYMDKRGYQQGLEFRYYLGRNSFGTVYTDYLRDGMDVTTKAGDGELFRDWRGSRDRWSWYLDHESRSEKGLSLRANVKKVSDNWYFKDFESHNYYLDHYHEQGERPFERVNFSGDGFLSSLTSTVRLTQAWDRFTITMLGQYTDNLRSHSNDETLQKYPEITLTGMKQPILDTPFDFELDSFYGYYYRTAGYRGHLFDAAPVVSLPLNLGRYARFIPEVGIRETRWDSTDSTGLQPGRRSSRTLYHLGSTLSSEVERIFSVNRGGMEKIRHEIRPELTYRYSPQVSQNDLPDFVEPVDEENSITYAVTNTLTARFRDEEGVGAGGSYHELARFRIGQTYDIREARRNVPPPPGKRPFSDIDMELFLSPHSYVSFGSDATLDAYNGDWKELNGLLRLLDHRGDSATVEYRYTRDLVEQLNLSIQARATDKLNLFYRLANDRLAGQNLETTYGVAYKKQCWNVSFSFTDSHDDRSFMLVISLSGLGSLPQMAGGF